jgi:NAD+ diphosphatase
MKIQYCVECGSQFELAEGIRYDCPKGHVYWNNPRAATAAILIKEDKILFAVRAHEPRKGKYDLPGGFAEHYETADDGIRRELFEETGLKAKKVEYLTSVANNYTENIHTCDIVYIISEWEGEIAPADDVESLEWRKPELLDTDEFAWQTYRGLSTKVREYMKDRDVS